MDSEQSGSGPELQLLTPEQSIQDLCKTFLLQHIRVVAAPRPADPTGSPSSTSIDQATHFAKPSFEESSLNRIPRGIFLNQSKYSLEIIKKYRMDSCDPVDTPVVEKSKIDEDPQGKAVDPTHYREMIVSIIYLTLIRPDLLFLVCIFSDADHAGCQDTRRSKSGNMQLLVDRLVREAMEASKRRRSMLSYKIQQLSKGSSKGSGIILKVPDEPKDNFGSSSSSLFRSDDEVQDVSSDEENKANKNKADAEVVEKQAGNE
ncbi:uncharacterized mitochondrial protein-like protein [Tanacetum coccineum]